MTEERRVFTTFFIIFAAFSLVGCSRVPREAIDQQPVANRPSWSDAQYGDGGASERRVITPKVIEVNGIPLEVEVARTVEEKARGLSGRAALTHGRGMLFPYDQPVTPSFWMKDMKFSIDIIWIRDGKVVDVEPRIPPPREGQIAAFLPTYTPDEPVTHVLEVPAGWAESNGVGVGSEVVIPQGI